MSIIISGAECAAAATSSLRPLEQPLRAVGIIYHIATGELSTIEYADINDIPPRGAAPDGTLVVCNAFSPLTPEQIIDLTERAVAVHQVREARAREEAAQ